MAVPLLPDNHAPCQPALGTVAAGSHSGGTIAVNNTSTCGDNPPSPPCSGGGGSGIGSGMGGGGGNPPGPTNPTPLLQGR